MAGGLYGERSLNEESVSNVTATNSVQPGARRSLGGIQYVYVYNGGGEDINPTYGATLGETVGTSGYTVTVSSTTSISPLAGVVKHATLTTDTYGWLLVNGICTCEVGTTTSLGTAAGEHVACLGEDGTVERVTGATGYLALGFGSVYALGKTAAGGSALCFVNGVL